MSQAAPCAFCEKPGSSEEDVFAKWIADVVGGEGMFTLSRRFGRNKTNLRYLGVTSRAACRPCNNGWMSRSEQETRPLLTPAIQDRSTRWESEAEQATVAAWAFKTALMFDRSNPPIRQTVPASDFTYFFKHQRPSPSRSVLLGRYVPGAGEEVFSVWGEPAWTTAHSTRTETLEDGYRITFSVGSAIFIVAGFANPNLVLLDRPIFVDDKPIADTFRPLWPLTPKPYEWPPSGFTFTTAQLALLASEAQA